MRNAPVTYPEQMLMIGNEMNRGRKQVGGRDPSRLKNCYERILRLGASTA